MECDKIRRTMVANAHPTFVCDAFCHVWYLGNGCNQQQLGSGFVEPMGFTRSDFGQVLVWQHTFCCVPFGFLLDGVHPWHKHRCKHDSIRLGQYHVIPSLPHNSSWSICCGILGFRYLPLEDSRFCIRFYHILVGLWYFHG